MSQEKNKGNSPANFRRARRKANARGRRRAARFGIFTREGISSPRLGRKIRRLAREGKLAYG